MGVQSQFFRTMVVLVQDVLLEEDNASSLFLVKPAEDSNDSSLTVYRTRVCSRLCQISRNAFHDVSVPAERIAIMFPDAVKGPATPPLVHIVIRLGIHAYQKGNWWMKSMEVSTS